MTYLFLDTNIYLHFKLFDEIPWKELVDDDFQILVPPIIITELDKHKRNTNSKIAARSKKVLTKIENYFSTQDFSLTCILEKPTQQIFDNFGLDRLEQDDVLFASIKAYQSQNLSSKMYLVTHDTGPRIRARHFSVPVLEISSDFLTPSVKTPQEVELEKIKKENAELKNKIPKVRLCFADGTERLEVILKPLIENKDEIFDKLEAREKEFAPMEERKVEIPTPPIKGSGGLTVSQSLAESFKFMKLNGLRGPFSVTKEHMDAFNKDRKDYLQHYSNYLHQKSRYKRRISLSFPIEIKMENNGNVPAMDIDIWIHFPDGFILHHEDRFLKKPKKPIEPHRPTSSFDMGPIFFPTLPNLSNLGRNSTGSNIDFNKPSIKKTNSYEVEHSYRSLKHLTSVTLSPMIVEFSSTEDICNFTIEYKLVIGNVPNAVEGELHVLVSN